MPLYLDTTGRGIVAIGLCARCAIKYPLEELSSDVNYPGLRCCPDCLDWINPYTLAPRAADQITLEYPRPDVPLEIPPDGQAPTPQAPGAVTNLVGVAGNAQATFTATAPSTGGVPTQYTLVMPGFGTFTQPTPGFIIGGLTNGTAYNGIYMFASNAAGVGPNSNIVSVSPQGVITVPGPPTNVQVQ